MSAFSQSLVRRRRSARGEIDSVVHGWHERLLASDRVRFVPAAWLVAVLGILRLWLGGRRVSKVGVARLLWSVAPGRLKLVAAGLGLASLIVLAGALAALTLLAIQLS
jgi:hypothetical protein